MKDKLDEASDVITKLDEKIAQYQQSLAQARYQVGLIDGGLQTLMGLRAELLGEDNGASTETADVSDSS